MGLADRINAIPGRIKSSLERAAQAAINPIDREVKAVLGVQGTPSKRSKPGEPPRRQIGTLQKGSGVRWTTQPHIRIVIYTTDIGMLLQNGTTRIRPRPFEGPIRKRINPFILRIVQQSMEVRT